MDEKPYLTRRNWLLEKRDRELGISVKNRSVLKLISVVCDGSQGGDWSKVEEESDPVRLGSVPSIGMAGDGGGVGDSVLVNSNRGGELAGEREEDARRRERVR
ncbi:unnamed protein product [Prunus armeniaca]